MSQEAEPRTQENEQTNEDLNTELQSQNNGINRKITQKLGIEEVDQENNIFEDSKRELFSKKCVKHPDEDLQFYCFNKEQLLCSECLVSGKYVGLEIANLRKAAEKLRGKFSSFVSEAIEKFEAFSALEEEIQSHEEEMGNAVSAYEEEITKLFDLIRLRINAKEQELINNLGVIKQERINEFKSAAVYLQNCREEIDSVKNSVEGELKNLDDLGLCKYYLEKTGTMSDLLNNKTIQTQGIKEMIENQQLQDQVGLCKLQDDCKAITVQVANLTGIESGKLKQGNKEAAKLGRVSSFFSSGESEGNTLKDSRDTLVLRPSTPSRSNLSQKPTYLPEDLMKTTSLPSPTNNIFEKHMAKVQEIRRQAPKQEARVEANILGTETKKPEARNSLMMAVKRNIINKKYSGLSINDNSSILDVYKDIRSKNTESKTPKTFMLSCNITPSNKSFGFDLASPSNLKANSILASATTKAADRPEKIGFDSSIRYMKLDRSIYELQNAELHRRNSGKPVTRESESSTGLNVEKMFAKRKVQENASTSNLSDVGMKQKLTNLSSSLFK